MNYEIYDSTKHTLKVGTKIRLAGREGEIVLTDSTGGELGYQVEWTKLNHSYINLNAYPLLEIAVSPLTIDKRVKEEIEKIEMGEYFDGPYNHEMVVDRIRSYLNSLEEV